MSRHTLIMRISLSAAAIAALSLAVVFGPASVSANPIERACVQSDRPGASRSLCRCIGQAADRTLSRSDMREGARFFTDPARAQEIQLSDTRRNDAFWSRWQEFGDTAEALCS
jgi:hypothetical protein